MHPWLPSKAYFSASLHIHCLYVCMYVFVHAYTYVCVSENSTVTWRQRWREACIYVSMCIRKYVYFSTSLCAVIYTFVSNASAVSDVLQSSTPAGVDIYIYIYIYIHTMYVCMYVLYPHISQEASPQPSPTSSTPEGRRAGPKGEQHRENNHYYALFKQWTIIDDISPVSYPKPWKGESQHGRSRNASPLCIHTHTH